MKRAPTQGRRSRMSETAAPPAKGHRKYWHTWTIKGNKKNIFLGSFKDKKDAAKAYNEAAIKYHGEFARLNIIIDDENKINNL